MPELPDRMRMGEKHLVPYFPPDEPLYRRIKPDSLSTGQLEADSVELPDMSTVRGGAGFGQPEDALWSDDGEFDGWGVCAFAVRDIPGPMQDRGMFTYTFKAVHRPHRRNYPHSEVQAFENGVHVDDARMELVNPHLHLRFREKLLRKTHVVLPPGEFYWR